MQPVTGITLCLIPLLYIATIAVLIVPGFDIQIKSVVVGAIFGSLLTAITGHWLNDVAKRTAEARLPDPVPSQQINVTQSPPASGDINVTSVKP